jgi:hypothetical protein
MTHIDWLDLDWLDRREAADGRASRRRTIGDGRRRNPHAIDFQAKRTLRCNALVGLNGAAEAGAGFGQTFVDDCQQRSRRERLAQSARGAELERHTQEVRRRRIEIGKRVSDIAISGTVGARS